MKVRCSSHQHTWSMILPIFDRWLIHSIGNYSWSREHLIAQKISQKLSLNKVFMFHLHTFIIYDDTNVTNTTHVVCLRLLADLSKPKLCIRSVQLQQLFMCSLFYYITKMNYSYFICSSY